MMSWKKTELFYPIVCLFVCLCLKSDVLTVTVFATTNDICQ